MRSFSTFACPTSARDSKCSSRCGSTQRYDEVPVVVLTGVTEVDAAEEELIQRHGAHLLYKRFGYREVVQRLEKIITAEAAYLDSLRSLRAGRFS